MESVLLLPLVVFLSSAISAAPLLMLVWRQNNRWAALVCTAFGHQLGYWGLANLVSVAGYGSSGDVAWLWAIGGFLGGLIGFAVLRGFSKARHNQTDRDSSGSARSVPVGDLAPADVFISYRRDERTRVREIARKLESMSLRVWFDAELRSGTAFDAEIDRQVRTAKCVLVCWSPSAVQSDWVRGEATIGRQRGVLAAVLLEPCDLPSPFNLTHTNDLTGGVGEENPEWLQLLQRIGDLVGRDLR